MEFVKKSYLRIFFTKSLNTGGPGNNKKKGYKLKNMNKMGKPTEEGYLDDIGLKNPELSDKKVTNR